MLDYLDDKLLRRYVTRALNRGEAYHRLKKAIAHEVMKVWSSRDDIVTTTANEFNAELDALLDKHCSYV